jgi:hypothetical protein
MSAPDFRALCAQLLDALEEVRFGAYPGHIRCTIDDARVALAQHSAPGAFLHPPEPEPPADMLPDPTNRPLWQMMEDAYDKKIDLDYSYRYAAEIRAIVGAMEDRFGLFSGDALMIVDWLRDEADKAEAGE